MFQQQQQSNFQPSGSAQSQTTGAVSQDQQPQYVPMYQYGFYQPQTTVTMPQEQYAVGQQYVPAQQYVPVQQYAAGQQYMPMQQYVPMQQYAAGQQYIPMQQYSQMQQPPQTQQNVVIDIAPDQQTVSIEIVSDQKKETTDDKFNAIVEEYKISSEYAEKIQQLQGFEIVYIVDDSGSMNSWAKTNVKIGETKMTRWKKVQEIVKITGKIATLFDSNGIDVYFLNRKPVKNVNDMDKLNSTFAVPPDGLTPLCRTLRQVLQDKKDVVKERKLLIMIATDGVPTNDLGENDIMTLRSILKNERNPIDKIFVSFLACTDDKDAVAHLNEFDKNIVNVDTVDDYESELSEVRKAKKDDNYNFSMGDYVVKSLVGIIDDKLDKLDEE